MFPALSSWDPVTQMNTGKPLSPFETHGNRNSCCGFQFHQRTARGVNSISRFTRSLVHSIPHCCLARADPTRRSQAALPAAAAPLLLELALSSLARLAPSVPPSVCPPRGLVQRGTIPLEHYLGGAVGGHRIHRPCLCTPRFK